MSFTNSLNFGSHRLPMMLQTESAECGLACLAMISSYYGYRIDLSILRSKFSVSLKGTNLVQIINYADRLSLTSRPLRLEIEEVGNLKAPCILHWDFNHFVVLKNIEKNYITVHDPAVGVRKLNYEEFSQHFTGIAVELTPSLEFKPANESRIISLKGLLGKVDGLWKSFFIVMGMALALEAISLFLPIFNQWVVDEALLSGDRSLLNVLAFGFSILIAIQTAITFARSWTVMYFSTNLGFQWATNVFSHLIRLPIEWFSKRHIGDIVSRFESIGVIQKSLTTNFIEAMLDGLMAGITLSVLAFYSVSLTLLIVGSVFLYALLRLISYAPLRAASQESLILTAKAQSCFLETIRGIQAIKLFGQEVDRRNRWMNMTVDAINRDVRTQRYLMWFKILNMTLFSLTNLLIFWLGAHKILDKLFTVGMLFAFSSYSNQFISRAASLVDKYFDFRMLSVHAERLADIVLSEKEKDLKSEMQFQNFDSTLTLENISFRYADGEPWILKNINITIQPGESVVITGPSGCGKTTLAKILLGLLSPTDGEIKFGGIPLKHLGNDSYRKFVATVMQDDQLFAGSLEENIAFFDTQIDRERIELCSKLAAVHDDILAMPMRFQTLAGDMGTSLSGGQKQRLLLARALYKQPKILVLDEATSHLDIDRERHVNQSLKSMNMTRISIAHRPETIAMADRIIHLESGMVQRDMMQLDSSSSQEVIITTD